MLICAVLHTLYFQSSAYSLLQASSSSCSSLCSSGVFIYLLLPFLQNRFQRCAMDCQDKLRDRGLTPNDSEFLTCLTKCTDDHVALVPAMGKRLEGSLDKAMKQRKFS